MTVRIPMTAEKETSGRRFCPWQALSGGHFWGSMDWGGQKYPRGQTIFCDASGQ